MQWPGGDLGKKRKRKDCLAREKTLLVLFLVVQERSCWWGQRRWTHGGVKEADGGDERNWGNVDFFPTLSLLGTLFRKDLIGM
jgi:hypothetical protein